MRAPGSQPPLTMTRRPQERYEPRVASGYVRAGDGTAVTHLRHCRRSGARLHIFGWLLGARVHGYGNGLGWGVLYGIAWWVLGGLILMPVLLGMPVFAPLRMAPMHPVAWGRLMGHAIFGLILGASFVWFRRASTAQVARAPTV